MIGGGGWSGDTADSYDEHQRRATAAMTALGEDAGALDEVAHLLRVNQDALDEQRDRLAEVPVNRGTELTFNPEDSDQSQLVQEAIAAAGEIRLHVELQLLSHRTAFEEKLTRLSQLVEDWQPRTIRMVNLNVGQGYGNWFGDPDGTDPEDIGDIAQLIADQTRMSPPSRRCSRWRWAILSGSWRRARVTSGRSISGRRTRRGTRPSGASPPGLATW